MGNIIDFIKEKSYYFLGGTLLIVVLLFVLVSCSKKDGGNSYENIEKNMVNAAKEYYSKRENLLPKEENGTVKVTISTLQDAELLKEINDPKNSSNKCTGYVEVMKVSNEYTYTAFLTCEGNYEQKYLTDIIKSVKKDEYGNGVYEQDGEYIYKGKDVNNYISFNNQLWRILKVDKDGDIKIILAKKDENIRSSWDTAYNSERKQSVGITTDYLHTDIRKYLNDYYETNFSKESKAKIVPKTVCVGSVGIDDEFSKERECITTKDNEKVYLMQASDYKNSSLDKACIKMSSKECSNYNYLSSYDVDTWLLTPSSENTYKVYMLSSGELYDTSAEIEKKVNPVLSLTDKIIIKEGEGTEEKPYIIK